MQGDLEAWGIAAVDERYTQPDAFEVWAEHWRAVEVFLACRTQWRIIAGMGGARYQGLDYPALESVMRMKGVEDTATVLSQITHIEAGALEALNSQ